MEVVGKQASISQSSAWSTPLPFNADHDPRPSHPRHPVQQVSHPSSSTLRPPSATNASNSDPQITSRISPVSVRRNYPISSDTVPLPQHSESIHPAHSLVRSESAPLNVWDDAFSSRFAGLSVDDSFPSHRVTFAPETTTHLDTSDIDLDFFDSIPHHSPIDTMDYLHQRPPHPRSGMKPPPPRSKSSIELAGFAAPPSHTTNSMPGPSAAPRTFSSQSLLHNPSSMQKRSNVSPWHKSAFDMIQDDFPRTPSPMFSSLLSRPSQSTTNQDFVDAAFRSRPSSLDRRSRLASTASLDLDLDRISTNFSDEPAIVPEPVVQTRNPPRHHRRSMSVNWADDLTGLAQDAQAASVKAAIVSSPSFTSIFPTSVSATSAANTASSSSRPGPGATVENVQTASPPRTNSPLRPINRGPRSNSPPHSNDVGMRSHAANRRGGSGSSAHTPGFTYHQPVVDRHAQSSFDDIMNSNISDYDYLCDQPDNVNLAQTTAQATHFPMQSYPSSQSHMPPPANTINPHQQALSNPHLPNMFPGMGLFPALFSNNGTGINGNAIPQIYSSVFGDEPPAESLKSMSMQMAACLQIQHQLYAAQVAQMAALAGSSTFATSTSPSGTHPVAGMGHGSVPSQGMQMRPTWDVREQSAPHRNPPRLRHHYDNFRGNGVAHSGNGKKSNGSDSGHKGRNARGNRRGHRSHEDVCLPGGSKSSDRGSMGGTGPGALETGLARSALLEDFRSTSSSIGRGAGLGAGDGTVSSNYSNLTGTQVHSWREWKLSELKSHVVEFATDQHGSRFIQQKLETASEEDKMAVLSEALTDTQRLMTDVFGNYVVQKLLDHGGKKAIASIALELEGRMLPLSLHMYGCRVVQKALEVVGPEKRSQLVKELDGHVLKCIRDQNGNHVIQKCVELVEADSVQFIVDAVQGQSVLLAGHSYGCRVVQRILEHGVHHQKAPIMEEIMSSVPDLIKDQYGNYVIQHVVEHGTKGEREVIMKLVRGEVCELSQHKFASNVVERCLQFGSLEDRQILIEILINGTGTSSAVSPIQTLVRDQFGNYVVQRVLDVALSPQRDRVVNILKAQVQAIKKYSYGKHIIARLEEHHFHHHHHHHHHHHRSSGGLDAVSATGLENAGKIVQEDDDGGKLSGGKHAAERGARGPMIGSIAASDMSGGELSNVSDNHQTRNQYAYLK